jgi:hypothetical protein
MSTRRRNPFDKLQGGEEPAAYIPPAASKARRNREWEKAHNYVVATYRGIPPELQAEIKKLAGQLGVPVGDVARAFLLHGLVAYRDGKLRLNARLKTGKLTLFPTES